MEQVLSSAELDTKTTLAKMHRTSFPFALHEGGCHGVKTLGPFYGTLLHISHNSLLSSLCVSLPRVICCRYRQLWIWKQCFYEHQKQSDVIPQLLLCHFLLGTFLGFSYIATVLYLKTYAPNCLCLFSAKCAMAAICMVLLM